MSLLHRISCGSCKRICQILRGRFTIALVKLLFKSILSVFVT